MASSSLSILALNYINFPTKVVFWSCKIIPTMVVASIVHRKVFTVVEYVLALCVLIGLVLFVAADWDLAPSFHPIGLAFVSLSVCANAIASDGVLGSSSLESGDHFL
jgi:adenosine 3'-phospho 5'-phosphosulfate transporter B3